MRSLLLAALTALVVVPVDVLAADPPTNAPRPTPLTRPDMKQLIEDMKQRKPRIPLPELTEDDKKKLGERGGGYEGRLRYHYFPASEGGTGRGSGFGFGPTGDEATLDNTFKVQLFWLVSRANNCQYCQGHQEGKLLRAGQKEDQIAALDGDWNEFGDAEKTAFAFARKYTYEPHKLSDADITGLRKHYKDAQILEMILSMAGNNAINRWKEGAGVPQSAGGGGFGGKGAKEPTDPPAKHSYLTPTSEKYKSLVSKVVAVELNAKGEPTTATVCKRPALEPRAEVEKALAAARKREPRLPLVAADKARELLPEGYKGEPNQFVRLLATFPVAGKARIASQISADERTDLKPLLRAQVSWIIARQDRAWYATGEAKKRLTALGQTDDQIYTLDGDWKEFTAKERSAFVLAQKLAASPVVLTDDDVADAVKQLGARDTVQLIQYVTTRASFDRITEAAGLQIEK